MCCALSEYTLYALLRTGSTQKFMKRPDMTERLLTDALTVSADKQYISTLIEHSQLAQSCLAPI